MFKGMRLIEKIYGIDRRIICFVALIIVVSLCVVCGSLAPAIKGFFSAWAMTCVRLKTIQLS